MPIDKSKFLGQFKAETKDHLEKLNQGILELEKRPGSPELLESLMKEAHTVKGSATMMGFSSIAEIAHKMEDGFENAPGRNVQMTKDDYDLLFECLDVIESLLDGTAVRQAKSLDAEYITSLCDQLVGTFSEGSGRSAEDVAAGPAASCDDSVIVAPPAPACPPVAAGGDSTEAASNAADAEQTDSAVANGDYGKTASGESIRVEVDKLNHLMNLSGEMLIAKIRLNELINRLMQKAEHAPHMDDDLADIIKQLVMVDENINLIVSDMQDGTLNLRMVPVRHLFQSFPRAMRDLARQKGKAIDFDMVGEDTHLDKNIIDKMKDPLMHLLRNAVDHGIESPDLRAERDKPAAGKITLSAYRAGSQVVLEVRDDGGGINLEKVRERALKKDFISHSEAQQLSREDIFQLLFVPGFTTCDTVTETSGRGVGLDVVHEEIARLKGTIEIESEAGAGTRFIMKLPLTLSITEALLISCGDDTFAIPIDAIVETTRIGLDEIESVETKEVITVRGQIIPLVRIHSLFSLPKKGIIEKRYFPAVIVQCAEKKLGLLIDEIIGHQDIVIKPLGDPLGNTLNIAGGTVLGDGRVVLILDIPSIINYAGKSKNPGAVRASVKKLKVDSTDKRILLAEDTPSTAMLERSVLEAAGFTVTHAKDGQEAIELASKETYDMIITDVLMPRMNGFELTEQLKKSPKLKNVPIVIVTTRGSDADKKRGLEAGADAYVLKQDFTSDNFLETIDRLLI